MRSHVLKKLTCLLLTAGLCLAAAQPSSAVEFRAKGVWLASFQYGQHGNFSGKGTGYDPSEDEFEARSRVRLQIDAVASENLSGQVYFEIGKSIWGKAGTSAQGGAALGADETIVKVKRAFIDWKVPHTDLKVRMGIQGLGLPHMALDGPTVFQSDVAAVTASCTFTPNVSVTAFWARPYNDNYTGETGTSRHANFMDNMDMGGLMIPLRFDGLRLTPWGMFAAIGPNVYKNGDDYFGRTINGVNGHYTRAGLLPLAANRLSAGMKASDFDSYATAWWAGLSGDITMWDPFRIAWDFMYGAVNYEDSSLTRSGWLAALLLEYKLDWVTLGLYGWYASGDDSNLGNGSERLPYVSNDYGVCSFSGTFIGPDINGLERDRVIGNNLNGTWGAGFRLKNMSFLDDLKHTFHISLMGGTNDPGVLKEYHKRFGTWMLPNKTGGQTTDVWGRENMYLTTRDYALEVGLLNQYQIYENFSVNVELGYVAMWLDKSDDVWGKALQGQEINDAWNASVLFIYSF